MKKQKRCSFGGGFKRRAERSSNPNAILSSRLPIRDLERGKDHRVRKGEGRVQKISLPSGKLKKEGGIVKNEDAGRQGG